MESLGSSPTWLEFNTYVNELLTVDNGRLGDELFTPKLIRQAVLEIQGLVTRYQKGNVTTLDPDDFTTNGSVSVADFPDLSAEIREATILRTNNTEEITTEHPCLMVPWEERGELVSGQLCINDNNGRIAISPAADEFYIYPEIKASEDIVGDDGETDNYSYELRLVWDGQKLDYEDGDATPFDESMAFCVFAFVKRELLKEIDPQLSASFNADYLARRQNLFLKRSNRVKT